MKRPRANEFTITMEGRATTVDVNGTTPESSPRRRSSSCSSSSSSCHRRQTSPLFPKILYIGSCFVAVLALLLGVSPFPTLPFVDASMTSTITSGIASTAAMTDLDLDLDLELDSDHGMLEKKRATAAMVWGRRTEDLKMFASEHSVKPGSRLSSQTVLSIEDCTVPAGKCLHCTFGEQSKHEECKETGNWQKFQCILPGDSAESESESADAIFEMKSCKYTDFDEGIAMIRLQTFCLLMGLLSLVSLKKQKRLTLSMFDRRKQQGGATATTKTSRSTSRSNSITGSSKLNREEEEIEFTPMTNQRRERLPLVENDFDRMEII